MHLRPKISQRVTNQLDFQYLYHFRSLNPLIFKILTSFAGKMAKNEKMRNSQISFKVFEESQILVKFAEIWTRQSLNDLEEIQIGFFENFDFFCFYANFSPINSKFRDFFVKNQHKIRKKQNFQKSLCESLLNHLKTVWTKFRPI